MEPWRKSTYSAQGGASCVEVANTPGQVGVRDTKQEHLGDHRTVLSFSPDAWQAFMGQVK
jgi:hypothetical protein